MAWLLIYFMSIVLSGLQPTVATNTTTSGGVAARAATMGTPKPAGCDKKMVWNPPQQRKSTLEESTLSDHLTLFNNVWGADKTDASKSNQSVQCNGFQDTILKWSTAFNFQSSNGAKDKVKSYSNVRWKDTTVRKISDLKTIDVAWFWDLKEPVEPLTCVVSLDLFASKKPGCKDQGKDCARTEVKIWLAAIGEAKPTGERKSTKPIILGKESKFGFDLWVGSGSTPVYTLIPSKEFYSRYQSFHADLLVGLKALIPYGFKYSELFFEDLSAGLEAFQGGGTLATDSYTLTIN